MATEIASGGRAEVFAGYSYARWDRGDRSDRFNLDDGVVSVDGHRHRWKKAI